MIKVVLLRVRHPVVPIFVGQNDTNGTMELFMEHLAGYDDAALETLEEMIVGDHDQKSSPNNDDILLDDMEDFAYGETVFEVEGDANSGTFSPQFLKSLDPNCTETFLNTTLVPRELRNNPTYVIVSTQCENL